MNKIHHMGQSKNDVRSQEREVCPVQIFFRQGKKNLVQKNFQFFEIYGMPFVVCSHGQGGGGGLGGFQMRMSALFGLKKHRIFRNFWCVEPVRKFFGQKGFIFSDFVRMSFIDGPYFQINVAHCSTCGNQKRYVRHPQRYVHNRQRYVRYC